MTFLRKNQTIPPAPPVSTYAVLPPDGGWGWVVVASAFYCNAVIDGILFTYGMYLPKLAKAYDAEESLIALVGSLMFGVHFAAGPFCVILSKSFGLRPAAVFGSCLTAISLAFVGLQPPLWLLMILLGIVTGVGMCLVYMASLAVTLIYFSRYRVVALGIILCGTGAGTVAFASAGSIMLDKLTWRLAFVVLSLSAAMMVVATMTFRPLAPVRVTTDPDKLSITSEDPNFNEQSIVILRRQSTNSLKSVFGLTLESGNDIFTDFDNPRQYFYGKLCCGCSRGRKTKILVVQTRKANDSKTRKIKPWIVKKFTPVAAVSNWKIMRESFRTMNWGLLKSPRFLMYCISGGLSCSAIMTIYTYQPLRSTAFHGDQKDETAALIVMLLGASNMVWRLVLGLVAFCPKVHFYALNITGHVIVGIAIIVSGFTDSREFMYVFCVICGFGFSCHAVFRPAIVVELVGRENVSTATGISLLFMGIASIIIPPFVGWIAEATDRFGVIYWIAGSCFIFTGFAMIFITNLYVRRIPEVAPEPVPETSPPITITNLEDIMKDPRDEFEVILNVKPEVVSEQPSTSSNA